LTCLGFVVLSDVLVARRILVVKVGVVGGTGYTGVELLRLLFLHPEVRVEALCSRSEAGQKLDAVYPSFSGLQGSSHTDISKLVFVEPNVAQLTNCDLVFFATPNGVAMNYARELLEKNIKVIDLAADFRFKDLDLWKSWYEMEHACPELLEEAVYGLPEMNREKIKVARLVGSAGCYTSAAQLSLLPLLNDKAVDLSNVIIDAKSGVSGAGRSLKVSSLFSESGENFSAYGVSGHRHQPEICHSIENFSSKKIGLTFVPHLVPMVRGIFSNSYLKINNKTSLESFQELYQKTYKNEPFVDVLEAKSHPSTKSVRASNLCRLALHQPNESTLVVLAVIDNLVKGASGQAIQNMNLMLGFDEGAGLDLIPFYP
jgi:N-acetyl-gamma-glutamyl-phosphate reductase